MLLDLTDIAHMPFNSAARQLVYAECGRDVRTTIADGRIVMRDGVMLSIDEAALGAELDDVMPAFGRHYVAVEEANRLANPCLLAANRRLDQHDIGLDRLLRDR